MQVHYRATFPGLQITRTDLLFTHGIAPSVAVVHAVAVDPGAAFGDLVFLDGEKVLMTFKDCSLDQSTVTPPMTRRGFRMRLNILDRRWKWKYPLISGRYNVRLPDATLREDTSTTYQELLEIVLETLGEKDYTIELPEPDLEPPWVEWYRQRADLQLAWLCDRIGCLIVLGLDNKIQIVPNGTGAIYPANGLELEPAIDTNPSNYPAEIHATFAPTRFQMKLHLEAVGMDNEGSILPLDDLSYTPDDGWESQVPGIFNDVADDDDRQLARDTVYRWYRIYEMAGGELLLPTNEHVITSIDDVLPLFPGLIVNTSDNYPQPAYVEGYFFNSDLKGVNEEEAGYARWDDDFVLDCQQGIVKFDYPVYYLEEDGHQTEADLYLTCTFQARESPTAGWWEHEAIYELPAQKDKGYGFAQVEQADVYRCIVQEYEEADPAEVTDNVNTLDEQGLLLAKSYARHYEALPQMSMQWNGIIPYPVTGNLHQIRWRVGGGPAITWGGKNLEYRYMSPSYSERKLRNEAARSLHL